jgi:hypothetical protein
MTNAERERVQGFGRLEEGLRQAGGWYLWVNRVGVKGETREWVLMPWSSRPSAARAGANAMRSRAW